MPNNDRTPPSIAEITALTARLRDLHNGGALADDEQARAEFLRDKDALLDRIPDTQNAGTTEYTDRFPPGRIEVDQLAYALQDLADARAEADRHPAGEIPVEVRENVERQERIVARVHDRTAEALSLWPPADADLPGGPGEPVAEPPAEVRESYYALTGDDPAAAEQARAELIDANARDMAAITASGHDWVDYTAGETLDQARERAAGYAERWTEKAATVDRERSPGFASWADRQAALWTDRATTPPESGAGHRARNRETATDETADVDRGVSTEALVAQAHDSTTAIPEPRPPSDEDARRAQLADWHHTDAAEAEATAAETGPALTHEESA